MTLTLTPGELTVLAVALGDAIASVESDLEDEPEEGKETRLRKKLTRYIALEEKLAGMKEDPR